MTDEAAKAAHAASWPEALSPPPAWDNLTPGEQATWHRVAAAVLAADPGYQALVRLLGAVDASETWSDFDNPDLTAVSATVTALSQTFEDAYEAIKRDHPHLLAPRTPTADGNEGRQ